MLQPKGMKKTVLLTLPKFRIETTLHLQDPLKKIGLRNMFSISANFSDMIENQSKLRIDKVVQKTFIYVNETGAEGDTGSGDKIPPRSVERNFTVDHPFMFYISETRGPGTILFVGKVLAPIYQKDVGV
ncbi:Serpin (serine protease inhibitor) [Popillia japonica]|uniref:Serpin (Serine protease inhibitor) n=1 Tax=Popillia japonica TaxID=7064 RepID=A0AAW1L972_POPJA